MSVYCELNSERGGYGYEVDLPLNHHYPIKCQQAFTIINVCVFVNTIHQEMDME